MDRLDRRLIRPRNMQLHLQEMPDTLELQKVLTSLLTRLALLKCLKGMAKKNSKIIQTRASRSVTI